MAIMVTRGLQHLTGQRHTPSESGADIYLFAPFSVSTNRRAQRSQKAIPAPVTHLAIEAAQEYFYGFFGTAPASNKSDKSLLLTNRCC
jgi:hypothetical protein